MALNSIYQLRFRQIWDTAKEQENVFFFDHTAGSGVAIDLAQDFEATFVPLINALQTNILQNVAIDVINLGDLGDFYSTPVLGNGAFNENVLPPFASIGFTQKVNTRAVRKGSKRISGIPESVQDKGKITSGTYITAMDNLRAQLQTELINVSDTWLPVVIKRVKTAVAGTVPTQYKYRLPTTDAELVVGEVVVCLTSPNITHQTSREV
jgi:hypothetical protein